MVKGLVCSVSDDKPVQEEDWVLCQHPECAERRRASKVGPLKLSYTTHRGQNHWSHNNLVSCNTEEQTVKPGVSDTSGQL